MDDEYSQFELLPTHLQKQDCKKNIAKVNRSERVLLPTDHFLDRLTGAQGILLFYNFLPDKHLTLKPNLNKNSCLKIENLSSDILDAAKKIIVNKQKSKGDAHENTEELEAKIDQLSSDNKHLRQKMSGLEQKLDEQNRKLDLLLRKL